MPLERFKKLIGSLQSLDFGNELVTIVENNVATLADLQREQMLEGRSVDGDYIRPFYSEDPYFKTAEAAKHYAEWKQRISPHPDRPLDVPNLFINGYFHKSLFAKVSGSEFTITTNVELGEKVFDEHENAQGLNEEKRQEFAQTITLPAITKVLEEKTGLQLTQHE